MEKQKSATDNIISYLTFLVGKEHYAINVSKIVNILEYVNITKVPKSPDYLSGVINLRGMVLPVVDANVKLGNGLTMVSEQTCILVLDTSWNNENVKFGALVDGVQEVIEITDDDILPAPSLGENYRAGLLSGIVNSGENFIMLLDIEKVFIMEKFEIPEIEIEAIK